MFPLQHTQSKARPLCFGYGLVTASTAVAAWLGLWCLSSVVGQQLDHPRAGLFALGTGLVAASSWLTYELAKRLIELRFPEVRETGLTPGLARYAAALARKYAATLEVVRKPAEAGKEGPAGIVSPAAAATAVFTTPGETAIRVPELSARRA